MSHPSSSQFVPPQSAQPYRSIFGGSSSQNVPESDPPHVFDGGNYEDDELDVLMEDQALPPPGSDDDDTYEESNAEESGSEASRNTRGTRHGSRKRKSASATRITSEKVIESPPPSPPSYRPNRFRGPESTWRKITLEDRQNAEALEDIRAKDLAAHLYNAYALRARARAIAQRDAEMGTTADAEPFVPPKRWAAWPMPASEVPRGDEHRRDDDAWTLKMPADSRPSADLEESIIAVMLRHAKERFNARPWRSRHLDLRNPLDSASQADTQDDSAAAEDYVKLESDFVDESIPLRPVVQADDDLSRKQLRPITRNIITEFDRLLLGLHHGRKGVVAGDDSSASEWQTDTESIASGSSVSVRRKRRQQNETARSQSRGRKRTRKSSLRGRSTGPRSRSAHSSRRASSASVTSHQPSRSSRSRGLSAGSDRRQSGHHMRLGLRDWSEVLGIAAMIGWPPAVVMRTAQRCGALFREDMAYRTFKEGKLQETEDGNPAAWDYAESDTGSSEGSVEPLPPPLRLNRSPSRAASTRPNSTSRPVSTEPEGAANERPKAKNERSTAKKERPKAKRGRSKGKVGHRNEDLVCPLRSCSRHVKGFSRTWNLNLHLKRMHPGYVPRDSGAPSSAVVVEDDTDDD